MRNDVLCCSVKIDVERERGREREVAGERKLMSE